ncbi:hypothetical protein K449DRAFT_462712 [Hypoxylon sp. EC38]|nr:hypothetical protein K449DRAFT_462712 [Hypoxylon sp. EC38]
MRDLPGYTSQIMRRHSRVGIDEDVYFLTSRMLWVSLPRQYTSTFQCCRMFELSIPNLAVPNDARPSYVFEGPPPRVHGNRACNWAAETECDKPLSTWVNKWKSRYPGYTPEFLSEDPYLPELILQMLSTLINREASPLWTSLRGLCSLKVVPTMWLLAFSSNLESWFVQPDAQTALRPYGGARVDSALPTIDNPPGPSDSRSG